MHTETAPPETTRRTTLSEIRDLATIPVWSDCEPNAAGLLSVGRSHAYALTQRGDIPVIRLGRRIVCKVPALLAMLGDSS